MPQFKAAYTKLGLRIPNAKSSRCTEVLLKYPNQSKSNFLVTLQLFYSLKNRIYSPQINVRNSAQYLDQSSLNVEKYYV